MEDFLNPTKVLNELKLRKNMTAADFGCGAGGWAIPLARILEDGTVYAIDILEEPISVLRSKTALLKIDNIKTIRSDIEKKSGSTLADNSVELVLMTNILFQTKDKREVLKEAERILKRGGRILIIDWLKDNPIIKELECLSFEEVKDMAKEFGWKLEREFKAGTYHYGLIFEKP